MGAICHHPTQKKVCWKNRNRCRQNQYALMAYTGASNGRDVIMETTHKTSCETLYIEIKGKKITKKRRKGRGGRTKVRG